MNASEVLGAARAAAKLALARALGAAVEFSHRGAPAATLWVRFLDAGIRCSNEGGILTEQRFLRLEAPVQTGFPRAVGAAEPVTPGDLVRCQQRNYSVLDPIEKDPDGFVYRLHCVERRRLAGGAR
jgi:hypothetical protein